MVNSPHMDLKHVLTRGCWGHFFEVILDLWLQSYAIIPKLTWWLRGRALVYGSDGQRFEPQWGKRFFCFFCFFLFFLFLFLFLTVISLLTLHFSMIWYSFLLLIVHSILLSSVKNCLNLYYVEIALKLEN